MGGDGGGVGAAVVRVEAVERRGLRRRGGPAVPAGVDTPTVPAGSGAPAVPDGMERGTTGGGEGGEGRGEGHPLFVPGEGDEQGREKVDRRWSGGGVWSRVEGDPVRDFGDRRVGGGGAVGDKVGVGEGGVPTWGEWRAVGQVAGVGLEEGLRAGTGDEARPKVGVQEAAAQKFGAFKVGEGREAVGSGTDGRIVGSSKGKRGSGK